MADNAPTIIGDSILVSGHLQGEEDLTVQGRVHGTVNLTKTLVIEETGVVKADVSVRNAIISGVVVGNVTATDSVELTEVGRMVGDISAPRVIIVEGARFRGNIDMGDLEAPRASAPLPARTVDRASLTKTGNATKPGVKPMGKPVAKPAPERRPPPPPPAARPAAAVTPPKPAAAVKPPPEPDEEEDETEEDVGGLPDGLKAPLIGKKKIKKKVVVKKRG